MHPDLAKLLEAGRINQAVATRLDQLAPGRFCLHKAWGAGKVIEWDLPGKKVTIDFEQSSGQVMDLQFAIQRTETLDDGDFRAKKVEQLEELRALSKSDPVELVVHLLASHGGTMTVDALEKELSGAVIAADDFRKWWESAKRSLRESKRVVVPSRRTDPLSLRSGDMSPAEALVSDFEQARDLKTMAKALEAITGDLALFKADTAALQRLLAGINETAAKNVRISLGPALELLSARDEMVRAFDDMDLPAESLRLSDLLASEENRLADALNGLASARQRAIYEEFPAAFGDRWVDVLTFIFDKVGTRGVAEIAKLLEERGEMKRLSTHLVSALARRSLGTDALIWVCRERDSTASGVFSGEVGACILNLLETDHLSDGPRKTTRLQSLLSDDKELLGDIVGSMDVNEARNFGRRLMECPVFNDLDRKSLMARVIKARPETGELVAGRGGKKEEELLVSWASLEKKKAELDDIINVRIPQNRKDITIAREYGDLRENFEYKSSKDQQKYLNNRKAELQRDISRARGTDFKGVDPSMVNVGTIVNLATAEGKQMTYTVLGAWDSDPEKAELSYLSELGAALLNKKIGDTVEVRDENAPVTHSYIIQSIVAVNP
ncbi:GreA/GreB family elongation factor [Luteolibacter arcticus]|uniref:GreA/GreB family elongation factor n=1 Tax=Luteolibacter arcticus TaxID=1581411 RepID=A0ABT3GDB2_9BACT|nr:GreA/GreB family elongation factor [Luteolibacter arcticus]MCW1921607.1 GreA/GreB family elongation factor [Luteolibacter arcticus]